MADSIAVLITKPPYGAEEGFAGSRLALACFVSGIVPKATLLLVGDGTLNAIATQRPEAIGMPSNLAALQDVIDLDGEVYCAEEDLRLRVGDIPVMEGVKLVSWHDLREVLDQHTLVTTF